MRLYQWPLKMMDHLKIKWIFGIILVLILLLTLQYEIKLFSSLTCVFKSDMQQPYHKNVIIFDGGSTGTRMHIYRFYFDSRGLLSIQNEVMKIVKQGLSKFANKPKEAANIISRFLNKAKKFIPYEEWEDTFVVFLATASFRAASDEHVYSVLREVLKVIENSPFKHNNESASILSGDQEALYAWNALNFLRGGQNDVNQLTLLIDVGGQSIQIVFAQGNKNTDTEYKFLTKQKQSSTLYARSYLGIGLVNAGISLGYVSLQPKQVALVEVDGIMTFLSPCIHPNETYFQRLNFKGILVRNQTKKEYSFNNCYNSAVEYLGDLIHKPLDSEKHEIYALSTLIHQAYTLNLIDEKEGNNCTVGKFVNSCKLYCESHIPLEPFLCLECTYISALWKHGLEVKDDEVIQFMKKIRGIESKWPLGAALALLT